MYNPLPPTQTELQQNENYTTEKFQYLAIQNDDEALVSLANVTLKFGEVVVTSFDAEKKLKGGETRLVVRDASSLLARQPDLTPIDIIGSFSQALPASGASVSLWKNAASLTTVAYTGESPWPSVSAGRSLVLRALWLPASDPSSYMAGIRQGGYEGHTDLINLERVVIAEVMLEPAPPTETELAKVPDMCAHDMRWFQIVNTGDVAVDLDKLGVRGTFDVDFPEYKLQPQKTAIMARSLDAFDARYNNPGDGGVRVTPVGTFDDHGTMSSDGYFLSLVARYPGVGEIPLPSRIHFNEEEPWLSPRKRSLVLLDVCPEAVSHQDKMLWTESEAPGGTPGVWGPTVPATDCKFGAYLPSGFEPSGLSLSESNPDIIWLGGDAGEVGALNLETGKLSMYRAVLGLDVEAIIDVPSRPGSIYAVFEGNEFTTPAILEIDVATDTIRRRFVLETFTWVGSKGAEAATWLPVPQAPEGGYFLVGSQHTGEVFVYELPMLSSSTDTTATNLGTLGVRPVDSGSDFACGLSVVPVSEHAVKLFSCDVDVGTVVVHNMDFTVTISDGSDGSADGDVSFEFALTREATLPTGLLDIQGIAARPSPVSGDWIETFVASDSNNEVQKFYYRAGSSGGGEEGGGEDAPVLVPGACSNLPGEEGAGGVCNRLSESSYDSFTPHDDPKTLDCPVGAECIWVSADEGNDLYSGTSKAFPVRTTHRAFELAESAIEANNSTAGTSLDSLHILLEKGVYSGYDNINLYLWSNGDVRNLYMRGQGPGHVVLDCKAAPHIHGFEVLGGDKAKWHISGLTIQNCRGVSGGGARITGGSSPVITDVVFERNEAGQAGGGLAVELAQALIQDSYMINNIAARGGGLTVADPSGAVVLENVKISNNVAILGGGISSVDAFLKLASTEVSGNEADQGGALYCENCLLYMRDSNVLLNRAKVGGGVVSSHSTFYAFNTTISENKAVGSALYSADQTGGGGIAVRQKSTRVYPTDTELIVNCEDHTDILGFDEADAEAIAQIKIALSVIGGGHSDCLLIKSRVSANTATGNGGGVALIGEAHLGLFSTVVEGNMASTGGGGGLFMDVSTRADAVWSAFTGNHAEHGGAVEGVKSMLVVDNSTISGNTADQAGGGFKMIQDSLVEFHGTAFMNNEADLGGAGYLLNSFCMIDPVIIKRNKAREGGGIYVLESSLRMYNGVVSNNTADYGGAVYAIGDLPLKFENLTVSENTALQGGGGAYIDSISPSTICDDDCNVDGNQATFGSDFATRPKLITIIKPLPTTILSLQPIEISLTVNDFYLQAVAGEPLEGAELRATLDVMDSEVVWGVPDADENKIKKYIVPPRVENMKQPDWTQPTADTILEIVGNFGEKVLLTLTVEFADGSELMVEHTLYIRDCLETEVLESYPPNDDIYQICLPGTIEGISTAVSGFAYAMTAIGCLLSLLGVLMLTGFRHTPIVRGSSYNLTVLFVSSLMVGFVAACLLVTGEDQGLSRASVEDLCHAKSLMLGLAYYLVFGTITLKSWRISAIVQQTGNAGKMPKKVKDHHLLKCLAMMLALEIITNVVWISHDPMHLELKVDTGYKKSFQCVSDSSGMFTLILLIPKLLLLIAATLFAYSARNASSEFNESKPLGLTVYNVLFVAMIVVPLGSILSPNQAAILECFAVFYITFFVLFIMLGRQVYVCVLHPELNVKSNFMVKSSSSKSSRKSSQPYTKSNGVDSNSSRGNYNQSKSAFNFDLRGHQKGLSKSNYSHVELSSVKIPRESPRMMPTTPQQKAPMESSTELSNGSSNGSSNGGSNGGSDGGSQIMKSKLESEKQDKKKIGTGLSGLDRRARSKVSLPSSNESKSPTSYHVLAVGTRPGGPVAIDMAAVAEEDADSVIMDEFDNEAI